MEPQIGTANPGRPNGAPVNRTRQIDCILAVEDVRVFNSGTVYMTHALPGYIRPFLVCLRGLAGPQADVSFTTLTFNRDPDGTDFGQLATLPNQPQPLDSEDALLRCLAGVKFMRYPDPARAERVPVGHLARLLSTDAGSSSSSSASSAAGGAERHLLLIIHSRLEDGLEPLKKSMESLASLTVLSPRRNDQLIELFGLVNGVEDRGDSCTPPHPKWELVLVPKCIRLSPPPPKPLQPLALQQQQKPAPAQLKPPVAVAETVDLTSDQPSPPPLRAPTPAASVTAAAPAGPNRLVWSGRLQFSKPNLCPVTNVQFVQLGDWSAEWSFRCFDQRAPSATCAVLKPDIAEAIERLPEGVGRDRLLVRPAGNAEMSPLLQLFKSADSSQAKMALIFCDLKAARPSGVSQPLARCLVARYDTKLAGIVATIPADQERFLRDMQTRFQQKQQQQQQQPQQPQPRLQQPPLTQSQPHVMVYMPPQHQQQQHQQQQQPQYRHQILSQSATKFPMGVATTSVYAMHPMQTATMVINPVAMTTANSAGGPPPAKISRIVDPAGYPPATVAAPPGMRIISSAAPGQHIPTQLMNAPVTIQRFTLPPGAYQTQQPQQQQQQQQQPRQPQLM